MTWKEFLASAYPVDMQQEERRERTHIFRMHRWVGLYLAYPLYHIGVSANALGIGRIAMALGSLYLLSRSLTGEVWLPFAGLLLLYGQYILDQSDGAIARVAHTVNAFGARLDGIANSFSRSMMVMLLAALTGNIVFLLCMGLVSYILVRVRDECIQAGISYDNEFKGFAVFFRVLFSPQAMLFLLPLSLVLTGVFQWNVALFSYGAASLYAFVTVFWFFLTYQKSNGRMECH